MATMKSIAERRQHPRVPPFVVQVKGPRDEPAFLGYVGDLSRGGLRLTAQRVVRVGDRLNLEFAVPGTRAHVLCACKVLWKRSLERKEGTSEEIGIRFLNLDQKKKRAIDAWVKSQLSLL